MLSTVDTIVIGNVAVAAFDRKNRMVYHHVDHNMPCQGIVQQMARLIVGEDVANRKVSKIAIGTDGSVYANTIEEFSSTAPEDKYIKALAIDAFSYPKPNMVKINWIFSYNDPPGTSIEVREYGLFNANGILLARTVKPVVTKTNDIRIVGTWTLEFKLPG